MVDLLSVHITEVFQELGAKEFVCIFGFSCIHLALVIADAIVALACLPLLQSGIGLAYPGAALTYDGAGYFHCGSSAQNGFYHSFV